MALTLTRNKMGKGDHSVFIRPTMLLPAESSVSDRGPKSLMRALPLQSMVEAIFGGEESDGHNRRIRFRLKEHREEWGTLLTIDGT